VVKTKLTRNIIFKLTTMITLHLDYQTISLFIHSFAKVNKRFKSITFERKTQNPSKMQKTI